MGNGPREDFGRFGSNSAYYNGQRSGLQYQGNNAGGRSSYQEPRQQQQLADGFYPRAGGGPKTDRRPAAGGYYGGRNAASEAGHLDGFYPRTGPPGANPADAPPGQAANGYYYGSRPQRTAAAISRVTPDDADGWTDAYAYDASQSYRASSEANGYKGDQYVRGGGSQGGDLGTYAGDEDGEPPAVPMYHRENLTANELRGLRGHDIQAKCWYYVDPQGLTQGPCTLQNFRNWLGTMSASAEHQQQYADFLRARVWKYEMTHTVPLAQLMGERTEYVASHG